jgi:hypothetical protein
LAPCFDWRFQPTKPLEINTEWFVFLLFAYLRKVQFYPCFVFNMRVTICLVSFWAMNSLGKAVDFSAVAVLVPASRAFRGLNYPDLPV